MPSSIAWPASRSRSRANTSQSVVLPDPLGPTMATAHPTAAPGRFRRSTGSWSGANRTCASRSSRMRPGPGAWGATGSVIGTGRSTHSSSRNAACPQAVRFWAATGSGSSTSNTARVISTSAASSTPDILPSRTAGTATHQDGEGGELRAEPGQAHGDPGGVRVPPPEAHDGGVGRGHRAELGIADPPRDDVRARPRARRPHGRSGPRGPVPAGVRRRAPPHR